MPYLQPHQYHQAQPLFEPFRAYHRSIQALLEGFGPGSVWADQEDAPHVAFASATEGYYLAGDPAYRPAYEALREIIPVYAYLLVSSPDWGPVLAQVWKNIAARPHPRQHFVFRQPSAPPWRDRLPAGYQAVPVDATFLARSDLKNHKDVLEWMETWSSLDDFFQRGAGVCMVQGNQIASWSLMDCAVGERCEIGVFTDPQHRRKGLGSRVVSAVLETCLARGYREIGWHCLRSNAGSIGVALRTGFEKERDYTAYSCFLPAQNPDDLTQAEWEDWAEHYERASRIEPGWAFLGAQAWTMAGHPSRALENLRGLRSTGWKGKPDWFRASWPLDPLRPLPEFQELARDLIADEPGSGE